MAAGCMYECGGVSYNTHHTQMIYYISPRSCQALVCQSLCGSWHLGREIITDSRERQPR